MLPNSQRNHFVLCIISSLGYKFNVKDGKSNGMSEGEAEEEGGGRRAHLWRLAVEACGGLFQSRSHPPLQPHTLSASGTAFARTPKRKKNTGDPFLPAEGKVPSVAFPNIKGVVRKMETSLRWRIREVKLKDGFRNSSRWHISASSKIEEVRRSGSLFGGVGGGSLSVTGSSQMWNPRSRFKVPRSNGFQMKICHHSGASETFIRGKS